MSEIPISQIKCPRCNKNRCSDRVMRDGEKKACLCRECAMEVFGEVNNEYYRIKREENGYE